MMLDQRMLGRYRPAKKQTAKKMVVMIYAMKVVASVLFFLTLASSCNTKRPMDFPILSEDDGLQFHREDLQKEDNGHEVVFTTMKENQKIFSILGSLGNYSVDAKGPKPKWGVFAIETGEIASSPNAIQIWLIDGRIGKATKLLSSSFVVYSTDDMGKYICYDDYLKSNSFPTVFISKMGDMTQISKKEFKGPETRESRSQSIMWNNGGFDIEMGSDGPSGGVGRIEVHE